MILSGSMFSVTEKTEKNMCEKCQNIGEKCKTEPPKKIPKTYKHTETQK